MALGQIRISFGKAANNSVSSTDQYGSNRISKGKNLLLFPDDYVVIDLETTGLSPEFDEIIEISAIRYHNNTYVNEFCSLIKPTVEIPQFISYLTGITNEMVATAPSIKKVLTNLSSFISSDDIVLGYNVNFDINFLYDNFYYELNRTFTNNFVDVMRLARRLEKTLPNLRLETLSQHYGIKSIHHRAKADCDTCWQCYLKLKDKAISDYGSTDSFLKQATPHYKGLSAKDIQATTSEFDEDHPFFGKTVVFTGTLDLMERRKAMQLVVNAGGLCGDGVTANTNYLILGNLAYSANIKGEKSSKLIKAEKLIKKGQDLQIISEDVFYDIFNEVLKQNPTVEPHQKQKMQSKEADPDSVSIEALETGLKEYDSILDKFDQMIVDYLVGKIKLKKTLVEDAPVPPEGLGEILVRLYRNKSMDRDRLDHLSSLEEKKRYSYQRRKTIVDRIDAKTRTIREPFSWWHEFHRDIEYEKDLKNKVSLSQS